MFNWSIFSFILDACCDYQIIKNLKCSIDFTVWCQFIMNFFSWKSLKSLPTLKKNFFPLFAWRSNCVWFRSINIKQKKTSFSIIFFIPVCTFSLKSTILTTRSTTYRPTSQERNSSKSYRSPWTFINWRWV